MDRGVVGHAALAVVDLTDGVGEGLASIGQGVGDGGEGEGAIRRVGDGLDDVAVGTQ